MRRDAGERYRLVLTVRNAPHIAIRFSLVMSLWSFSSTSKSNVFTMCQDHLGSNIKSRSNDAKLSCQNGQYRYHQSRPDARMEDIQIAAYPVAWIIWLSVHARATEELPRLYVSPAFRKLPTNSDKVTVCFSLEPQPRSASMFLGYKY